MAAQEQGRGVGLCKGTVWGCARAQRGAVQWRSVGLRRDRGPAWGCAGAQRRAVQRAHRTATQGYSRRLR